MPTPLINVSNRLPVTIDGDQIKKSSGGLVAALEGLPAGEYEAAITAPATTPKPRRSVLDLPVHHGPWDDSLSLRREDMYGDDGR